MLIRAYNKCNKMFSIRMRDQQQLKTKEKKKSQILQVTSRSTQVSQYTYTCLFFSVFLALTLNGIIKLHGTSYGAKHICETKNTHNINSNSTNNCNKKSQTFSHVNSEHFHFAGNILLAIVTLTFISWCTWQCIVVTKAIGEKCSQVI